MPETDRFDCQLCDLANNIDDMVQCEGCGKWFHYGCVGFDDGKKEEHWKCQECVAKSTLGGGEGNSSAQVSSEQQQANSFPRRGESLGDVARLNLELLEERKAFLLKEIELQQAAQLEQRKLQLEKEVWKARYDIVNARGEAASSEGNTSGLGDWMHRLNQFAVSQFQPISVAASAVTVPTTISGTRPPHSTVGGIKSTPQTSTSFPAIVSLFGTESGAVSQPTSSQAIHQQSHLPTSVHPMGQATSFMHDFQPGGGANRPGSSTPITTANWVNPVTGLTSSTQALPPSISSVGQFVNYPMQSVHVSQPYQVTTSLGNFASVGQVACSQYANCSVGPVHPQMSTINAHTSYTPFPLPTSLPQVNPHISQAHFGAPMVPVANIDNTAPTARQLAARHVMPKELPVFTGNSEEWPMFFSAFNTSTEACGYSNVENLGRLQRCLKGGALEAVRSRLLLPASVPQVMQTLQMLYGRPEQIIYALLQKVREVPAPKADNLCTVVAFGMAVQNFCEHLEAAGQVLHFSNPVLLQELVDKLPANLKLEWVTFKRQFAVADLRVFSRYMANLVSAAAEVTLTLDPKGSKPKREEKQKGFVNAHATPSGAVTAVKPKGESTKAVPPTSLSITCLVCGDPDHRVKECGAFKKMNPDDRWKTVRDHFLCRICLGKHGRKPCRSTARCDVQGCQMRHHPLLHSDSGSSSTSAKSAPQGSEAVPRSTPTEGVNAHHTHSSTLFRMLPVRLFSKGRSLETLAFIDEGSSVTLLEKGIADALQAEGAEMRLCLTWTSNISREEEGSRQVEVEISGIGGGKRYPLKDVRTVESLALPVQTLRYNELADRFEHLRKLPVTDFESTAPGILIGAKNTHLTATQQIREGRVGEPIAAKTRLGWAIYGSMPNGTNFASCNLHICGCDSDNSLHELVKQYFTVDNVGVAVDRSPESDEDKRARTLLEQTTRRVEGGFETGLLWRYDHVEFPDNYAMAARRLRCLEKRFIADPALFENVQRQIAQYQQKGYIHEATEEELATADPRRLWYLPVGIVRNPKKPNKIRIVWDAAATVDGVSLNSMLLKGPDLVQPLPNVLCGFRERKVAVVGDIMEMFHQLKIRPEDRYSQLFLWSGDTGHSPKTFVIDVATFGSTSSPCSAQYVKNVNASEHAEEYPRAAEAIVRRHYVDDYLQSFDNEEEACQVIEEVKLVHRRGGFIIRNWLSNSSAVLQRVGESDTTPTKIVSDGGAPGSAQIERVLGMQWKATEDVLVFSSETDMEVNPTKRSILRYVMSQFDPLGLLSHFLIHGRIIIQDIWRTKAGWDDTVDGQILERWCLWTAKFKELKEVRIPRAYFPGVTASDIENLQLHVFVDGSETAYACVAYFRATIRGEYHCALVGGKAKVAPIKALSIPRLELQAALIGCRLMKTLCNSHSLPISQRVFWTDSKTVLSWIHSDHRRYRQFVACRIGEILSKSNPVEWRYVPSKANVADDGTKWASGPNLKTDSRWFRGPDFLWKSEESWPRQAEPEATIVEIRPCHVHLTPEPCEVIAWSRFSKFERLKRTVAYIYRFADNCRRKATKLPLQSSHVTHEELNKAENAIWRLVQQEQFPEEMIQLLKAKEGQKLKLNRSSKIYKLSPFIDEAGVARMDTRIAGAIFVPFETKFPIILPKGHRLTKLVVEWYHRCYLHGNVETVINEVRRRFHVPCLRALVRNQTKTCVQCKVSKAKPTCPREAPLPDARLSPYTRPFSFVGLDYFGPIQVKVGRSLVKRWVALFTCLTVRAVHLEVVHSLSTEACKMAIRRFVVRRGAPLEIRSDNGTNFLGASRELRQQIQEMNKQLSAVFTNAVTKWVFNPPSAPHMGGSWERLVRSIKVAFSALSTTRNPDDETLLTLMIEAEGIVNTRPLTFVSLESEAQAALTPNHFLLLSSQGVAQPPMAIPERPESLRTNWRLTTNLVNQFWQRWVREYLPTISGRTKWYDEAKEPKVGDLAVVVDPSVRNGWLRGRIISAIQGRDGRCRQVLVKTSGGVLRRPVTKVAILDVKVADDGEVECNAVPPEALDVHYGSGDVGGNPTPLPTDSAQHCFMSPTLPQPSGVKY
ncbi:uncharacterized protein LOC115260593 [Aedes albopictus]|uniref:Uncharacterized protein n=1 Tax=Aedes albopictus TaxID=7160 RepID=A0ABM2A0Y6_AEDAL